MRIVTDYVLSSMNQLCRFVARSLAALTLLLALPALTLAAQDTQPPCPFADDRAVSQSLGMRVQGYADPGTPGYDSCEFGDTTVIRQSGAFAVDTGGYGALGRNVVFGLPEAVADQIGGIGMGRTLEVPGYQIATPAGLGDAALWVKNVSLGVDALVIQRGTEAFAFQVLDRPDAQQTTTALARAVLASAPAAPSASAPSGVRAAVVAQCGLDPANAVADRLQPFFDVSSIDVIGGCHYVAIATALDGSGIENASTAQKICDFATEVAYGGGILGITVTDQSGHERASGANGEPCSGFP